MEPERGDVGMPECGPIESAIRDGIVTIETVPRFMEVSDGFAEAADPRYVRRTGKHWEFQDDHGLLAVYTEFAYDPVRCVYALTLLHSNAHAREDVLSRTMFFSWDSADAGLGGIG